MGGPEFRKAKRQVRELAEAFPDCDWMIGNHDALTHRQAESAGLPLDVLKGYSELWKLATRGIGRQ